MKHVIWPYTPGDRWHAYWKQCQTSKRAVWFDFDVWRAPHRWKLTDNYWKSMGSRVILRKQTWKWCSVFRIRQGRCWRKAATRTPEHVHSGWQCDWYRLRAGYSAGECVQHWRPPTAELQRSRSKQRAKELHTRSHNSSYGTQACDMLRPKSTAVLAVPCYRGWNVNHATP